jgi:hypothetical protein
VPASREFVEFKKYENEEIDFGEQVRFLCHLILPFGSIFQNRCVLLFFFLSIFLVHVG